MSVLSNKRALPALGAVAAAILLGACNGSSDSGSGRAPALTAQAVDGYLVGSGVFCDGAPNNATAAAGRFECPAATVLYRVRGGADVGFDATKTDGGTPFVGELSAPATLSWVTPLSTLAVALSSDASGRFIPSSFAAAVQQLAAVFGESSLDLNADASTTMQLVRLNAQINQVISAFVLTDDDYATVGAMFASLIADAAARGATFSLTDGVDEVLTRLNTRLTDNNSPLAKSNEELGEAIAKVQSANIAIAGAERPTDVPGPVAATPFAPVLTIDRDEALVEYTRDDDITDDGVGTTVGYTVTLADFERDVRSGEGYPTVVYGDTDRLFIGQQAFDVQRTLDARTISLGFELESTNAGDPRAIAVTTDEAKLTTRPAGDGMTLTLPAGSTLDVTSTDADGTTTSSTIELARAHEFASANDSIEISFWRIDERLDEKGFGDLTAAGGDYRLTAVIGGVRVGERENGVTIPATPRTVEAGEQVVTGPGFRGYVTFVPRAER